MSEHVFWPQRMAAVDIFCSAGLDAGTAAPAPVPKPVLSRDASALTPVLALTPRFALMLVADENPFHHLNFVASNSHSYC